MTEALYWSATAFRVGNGFDSSKQYLWHNEDGAGFPVVIGKSLDFYRALYTDYMGNSWYESRLRYSVNGYVQQLTMFFNEGRSSGSFDATILKLELP